MQIAVCGAGVCGDDLIDAARTVGRTLAEHGATVLTGGLVVGVLPDLSDGNPYLSVRIRTGMGHARNVVLVQSAEAVVAVGGELGTLSELAIALKEGVPAACYRSWDLPGAVACATPEEAALAAIRAASSAARRYG